MTPSNETLLKRLLRSTLYPALLVVLASTAFDYLSALRIAQQGQDRLLQKTAIGLVTRLGAADGGWPTNASPSIPAEEADMLRADPEDDIHFLIVDEFGNTLAGDELLRTVLPAGAPATADAPNFSSSMLNNTSVRLIHLSRPLRNHVLHVYVTETNNKLQQEARLLLINAVWPNVLLLAVMAFLIKRGIAHALSPLAALGDSIDKRSAQDLQPIPLTHIPGEILPLTKAFNRLLERISTSITEQKTFLSGAAHQLRTPLAGIQTQLELTESLISPDLKPRLQKVQVAIQRLSHCTQQMLTLARSSTDAVTGQDFQAVDLAEVLEDAASRWIDQSVEKNLDLSFDVAPAVCTGSKWMIQELLDNLIDNAIKYSPQGRNIHVQCGTDPDGAAWVSVSDQGVGIPPEHRANVLRPFFRIPQTYSDGSGLGLAIVKRVADLHRAQLSIGESGHATGTTIALTFPPTPHSAGARA